MSRLPSLTPTKVIRALRKVGFEVHHQTGAHAILKHADGRRAVVSMHAKDIKRGTLRGILDEAGLTPEQFIDLL